ncbi:MAG: NUMOD3 domain-containing DNA-binding protein [Methylococcaceae bacterium]
MNLGQSLVKELDRKIVYIKEPVVYEKPVKKAQQPKTKRVFDCVVSAETREKIGAAQRGKIVSKETRYKLSNALKGHAVSDLTAQKISLAVRGQKRSDEIKAKMSQAQLKRYSKSRNLT